MTTTDNAINRRILVIDDNPAIHDDFCKILCNNDANVSELLETRRSLFGDLPLQTTLEGFVVDCAEQGQQGFAMVQDVVRRGCPYAVAFVDMRVPPGWDGVETIGHLWRADPELQIVICTAYADLSWELIIQRLGQSDKLLVLRKPFDPIEVWQLASALTQKWHLAQQAKIQLKALEQLVEQRTIELQQAKEVADARKLAEEALQAEIGEREKAEVAREETMQQLLAAYASLEERTAQLRQTHREAAQIVTAISSLLISTDAEGQITRWNAQAELILGRARQEVAGRRLDTCGLVWDGAPVLDGIRDCRRTGCPVRLDDIQFTRPDGQAGFLVLTISPMRGEQWEDRGALILGRDITEYKKRQQQLVEVQKLEAIGQLAAGIAHEINTPTQYINDNTSFLRGAFQELLKLLEEYATVFQAAQVGAVPNDLLRHVKTVQARINIDYLREEIPTAIQQSMEGLKHVADIVRAMKEFAHPDEGEKVLLDLNRTIENIVKVARSEWKYTAKMALELDPALPEVLCFPGEISQAILNIVVNAAHAITEVVSKENGTKGTIVVTTCQEGPWIEVRVADTGAGIPADVRHRIFEPFFTTKDVGKGTGQGLAITHAVVVEKHGGTLTFETEVGRGTTFILRLPLDTAQPEHSHTGTYSACR